MEQFIEFAIKNWYLFAALLVILGFLIGGEVVRKVRGIDNVTPARALQVLNHDDAVVLDIRDLGDYKAGHISDARHIPLNSLKDRLGELTKFKNKPIIVYCQTGGRSGSACALLKKNGFDTVYNLSGGLSAWQGANLPVKKK